MTDLRKLSIVGVSTDVNSSFLGGPRFAPQRIREALFCGSSSMATELGLELSEALWQSLINDHGDLAVSGLVKNDLYEAIHAPIAALHAAGQGVLALGGDHFVSYPLISAAADAHPGLSVLHIDAHTDLYNALDGNWYSHGSPFARLMEGGKIKRLVQVGIRALNSHQREQAQRFGVEIIEARDMGGVGQIVFDGPVYVSLDLDALDPAYAPGVSHHEPGGLSTRQVLDLLTGFQGQLVSADIVELNPHRDINNMTAMVAAKFVKELAARILIDRFGERPVANAGRVAHTLSC